MGIPPSKVRPERRQRLHYVRTFLLFESHTDMKDGSPDGISMFMSGFTHRGLISGVLVVGLVA
jgi:hypothetical protein